MSCRGLLAGHPVRQNLLLFAASVVVCLAALEGSARFLLRGGTMYPLVYYQTDEPNVTLWCYDLHARTRPDFDLRIARPFRSITYRSSEGSRPGLENLPFAKVPLAIEVRRNADGFRERPFSELQNRDDVTLVVGDSFCFGQGVRTDDRLTELLEDRLRENGVGHDPAVVNLCRASADIEQIEAFLELGLECFPHARRVIYVYNLNDPVREESVQRRQRYINDLMHLREYKVVGFLPRFLRPLGRSQLLRLVLTRAYNRRITEETEDWYRQLNGDHAGWDATTDILERMHEECARRSVEFRVAVFPVLHRLADYPFRDVHARIRRFCDSRGIAFTDLLPAFEGAETESLWVHPTDFHPNHLAHARVVPLIEAAIVASPQGKH